jgi:hypothetical protein
VDNAPDHFLHKIEDVFDMYSEVCEWFNELGLGFSKNRYGKYKKNFDLFMDMDERKSLLKNDEKLMDFKKSFDNAYIEANEIIRVYNNLKGIETAEFIDQIKKVVSGQELRASSDNDQARDFLFELSIACRFIKAGFEVSLTGICDVVVDLGDNGKLFVECKRIKSENKIEANVKKANKQIVSRTKASISSKAKGLVAVNITDLLPKTNIFYPESARAATSIHRGASNNYVLSRIERFAAGQNKKCLGVMCESAMMHYLSEHAPNPGFCYSRHTEYLPYHESSLYKLLVQKISRQDIV